MPSTSPSSFSKLVRLLRYARPYLWVVGVAIAASLTYAVGETGRAYLLRPLADDVLLANYKADSLKEVLEASEADSVDAQRLEAERQELKERVTASLWEIAMWTVFILLGMPLARFARDFSGQWLVTRLYVDLQADLGTKLLVLPLSHHERGSRGDFISRMTSDTLLANRVQDLVVGGAVRRTGRRR